MIDHPGLLRWRQAIDEWQEPEPNIWNMTDFAFPVTLDWARRPSMERWNEICAWTIEHFGLPGMRYQTEVSTARMTWYFASQDDQLLMTVAWGNDNDI